MNPSLTSLRRLAIAKQMYMEGVFFTSRPTQSNLIQSIIDFDFCVESVIKAVLLDYNIPLNFSKAGFKHFDTLYSDLKVNYKNEALLREIDSLHQLRNRVQHDAEIPSMDAAKRYETSVKLFFEDICSDIYKNAMTFDSISLALFIESEVEKVILSSMEERLSKKDFKSARFYATMAIFYHKHLLDEEMKIPYSWSIASRMGSDDLDRALSDLEKRVDWIIDHLMFMEHQHEVDELLGRLTLAMYSHKDDATEEEAEWAKIVAYNIILDTQWRLREMKDDKNPCIYDFDIIERKPDGWVIRVGIASAAKIVNPTIKVDVNKQTIKQVDLPENNGLHEITIDGLGKGTYVLILDVKNESNGISQDRETLQIA